MTALRKASNHAGRCALCIWFLLLWCVVVAASGTDGSPFAPLPVDHWAYGSLSRLSATGLLGVGGDALAGRDYVLSRYEMAIWFAQALDMLREEGRVADDVTEQITLYNAKHPGRALSAEDVQALNRLLSFLRPELNSMGDIAGSPRLATVTLSPSDTERQLLELGVANAGVLRLQTRDDARAYPHLGLGLSLDLGDVLLTMGQSTSTHEGQLDSTTELGLNVRMQNVQLKLGYSAQGAAPTLDAVSAVLGTKRTASAGLEYLVTPQSRASADVRYSADVEEHTTTTDFGLRFNQQGTSVTLGYRLVDYAGSKAESSQEVRDNIATAEFTIRF